MQQTAIAVNNAEHQVIEIKGFAAALSFLITLKNLNVIPSALL